MLRTIGRLPSALQDPAVAPLGHKVYAFGGLTSADSSSAGILRIDGPARTIASLPVAIHDAAAATVAGKLYVLGGGQLQSYPGIGRFDPATGTTHVVTDLPTPLSDLAVATVGSKAYAVGGYTGSVFSRAIVAFDGTHARTVAHLPVGLRYTAVSALGGNVLIAGGRSTSGPSSAIYRFRPADGSVTRVGTLPAPLMHAGAGVIGSTMYVIGGIGSDGQPTNRIVAINASGAAHTFRLSLPTPLSDAGVATLGNRLLIIGGNNGSQAVTSIQAIGWVRMRPAGAPKPPTPSSKLATSKAAMFKGPLPGDLLIADRGNDRLLVVNPAHKILWEFPRRPGQIRLHFDDDAFFTPGGKAIISNEEDNHDIVQIAYPSGKLEWRYGHPGAPGSSPGYLNTPDDAYRLANGMVIVSDDLNCRVLEIRGFHVVRSIGTAGVCRHDPPRYIGLPNGDTPLPDGHILISEITGSYIDEVTMTGKLVRSFRAPVSYPSDPQLTNGGNIMLADYSRPGGVVILDRQTGKQLWRYQPASGSGMLDHPSLASMLPNGNVIVGDDYNNRIVVINPRTKRIVWQYGHTAVGGTSPGYLHIPDGFDFIPVHANGSPNYAAIQHGPPA